ncbi:MAG TPA: hypothetical protein VFZ78_00435 [Flavisolibacter sp.]
MEEKNLTEQESLRIIQQMISTAKNEQKDNGMGWILWGWLLFLASLFTFLNLRLNWLDHFFFWNAFGAITILLLLYQAIRFFSRGTKVRVRTFTSDLFSKLNMGFILSLFLIIVSMNVGYPGANVPPVKGFALLLGLYGFWILIYGAALNFRPSIIGAYLTWGFAFASLFVTSFEWTMILHAIAVLCGYIIPGHIAYREFNKISG